MLRVTQNNLYTTVYIHVRMGQIQKREANECYFWKTQKLE
jgi:hypothetical protein